MTQDKMVAVLRDALDKVVYLEWLDSMGYDGGWMSRCDIKEGLPTLRSAGIVVYLDDMQVTLALSVDPDNNNVAQAQAIPLFALTRAVQLTV